jgi:CRISPR-associated protein Cst2
MKAITLTIVTHKAQSLNYGETIGNISTLKKLTQNTGHPKSLITYFSDKAIKYDVKRIGRKSFGWKLMDQSVVNVMKGCVVNINGNKGDFDYNKFYEDMVKNFEEFDLFGGMFADIGGIYEKENNKKTNKIKINGNDIEVKIESERLKRTQPVRFTNGYSISEFSYDTNLLNDIDAYNRYIQYTAGQKEQSLVFPEEHYSYYTYTLNIDLDQIGAVEIEETDNSGKIVKSWKRVITLEEKKKRIKSLLEIVLLKLYREIKGRDENLTPVFVIGGVYDVKQPFFHNAIRFYEQNNNLIVEGKDIEKIFNTYKIKEKTYIHHCNQVTINDEENIFEPNNKKENLREFLEAILKEIYLGMIKEFLQKLNIKESIKIEDISNKQLSEIETKLDNISEEEKIFEFEIEIKISRLSEDAKEIKSNLEEKIKSIYKESVLKKLGVGFENTDSKFELKEIKIENLKAEDLALLNDILNDITEIEGIINEDEKKLINETVNQINEKITEIIAEKTRKRSQKIKQKKK